MKPMAVSKSKAEREDAAQVKARAIRAALTQYTALKQEAEKLDASIKEARTRVAELTGVGESCPVFEMAGVAKVNWIVKQGSRKIDRALLVKVLMEKAGASGEQANKLADLATVQGEGSQYVEIRPVK